MPGHMMTWVDKYWDSIDQLYWNPSLLGLAPVPKTELQIGDDTISIPKAKVRNGGSIYTRKGTAAENAERMRRLEEPLNHIFDITFGTAPDAAIQKLFGSPLGFDDAGPFERLGREISTKYEGFANSNTTQQDGFFVGKNSLIGVELKLGSKTWPGQALKYLALMVAEEKLSGWRDQIGLLYITPDQSGEATFSQLGADADGRLPSDFIARVPSKQINRVLGKMIEDDRALFDSAVNRLYIAHRSWKRVADDARQLANAQDAQIPAGQTYRNLMEGFAEAIASHTGCI